MITARVGLGIQSNPYSYLSLENRVDPKRNIRWQRLIQSNQLPLANDNGVTAEATPNLT